MSRRRAFVAFRVNTRNLSIVVTTTSVLARQKNSILFDPLYVTLKRKCQIPKSLLQSHWSKTASRVSAGGSNAGLFAQETKSRLHCAAPAPRLRGVYTIVTKVGQQRGKWNFFFFLLSGLLLLKSCSSRLKYSRSSQQELFQSGLTQKLNLSLCV